jgi:exonuclease VII small subunit
VRRSALLAVILLAACEASAKREATSLDEAVDQYRRAEGSSREAASAAVGALSCSAPDVCDAKKACVDAIGPTTRALALKEEVARVLDAMQRDAGTLEPDGARDLPAKLDEATALLREGREKMGDCERKLGDLRARYGR